MTGGMCLKVGERIGKFTVLGILPEGSGGMARIVRVSSADRGMQMVLKISRAGRDQGYYYSALHREVEILRMLQHPGIVSLLKVSDHEMNPYMERAINLDGSPWFCGMEYLLGGSLKSYLRELGRLSLDEGVGIGLRLCDALLAVHQKGYAHNDLKSENVLFRSLPASGIPYDPVLIDFGIASPRGMIQQDGSIVYMAPERLRTKSGACVYGGEMDQAKADVWSMGVLLYRFFTTVDPFIRRTDRKTAEAIYFERPASLLELRPDLPESMGELIVDGCLAKEPDFRPGMEELCRLLAGYLPSGLAQRNKPASMLSVVKKLATSLYRRNIQESGIQ